MKLLKRSAIIFVCMVLLFGNLFIPVSAKVSCGCPNLIFVEHRESTSGNGSNCWIYGAYDVYYCSKHGNVYLNEVTIYGPTHTFSSISSSQCGCSCGYTQAHKLVVVMGPYLWQCTACGAWVHIS